MIVILTFLYIFLNILVCKLLDKDGLKLFAIALLYVAVNIISFSVSNVNENTNLISLITSLLIFFLFKIENNKNSGLLSFLFVPIFLIDADPWIQPLALILYFIVSKRSNIKANILCILYLIASLNINQIGYLHINLVNLIFSFLIYVTLILDKSTRLNINKLERYIEAFIFASIFGANHLRIESLDLSINIMLAFSLYFLCIKSSHSRKISSMIFMFVTIASASEEYYLYLPVLLATSFLFDQERSLLHLDLDKRYLKFINKSFYTLFFIFYLSVISSINNSLLSTLLICSCFCIVFYDLLRTKIEYNDTSFMKFLTLATLLLGIGGMYL